MSSSYTVWDSVEHNSVQYLGHVVSNKGIHTDPSKVQAVLNLPDPKNLEELRSFLGLVGYYLKFIPSFAALATPLHVFFLIRNQFISNLVLETLRFKKLLELQRKS